MGTWGEYDDENDHVADEWIAIESKIMPKSFDEIKGSVKDVHFALNTIRRAYAINNPTKVYAQLQKWLGDYKKYMKKYKEGDFDYYVCHGTIIGVLLKAIRTLEELPASDPLGSGIFNSGIPKELPNKFPEILRKEAVNSIEILLDDIDIVTEGWKNPKARKDALNHELFLFTKGKKGIKGKFAKSDKISAPIACKKGSRKGSKKGSIKKGSNKSSRKGSIKKGSRKGSIKQGSKKGSRKGPSISATSVKVGTIKTGNDGNTWITKDYETKNGIVQRWVKY